MKPTPGRIVLYRICEYDIQGREFKGNTPRVGDVVPLIVVRVWDNEYYENGVGKPGINGQLILDCSEPGMLWVASKPEGEQNGAWFWPPRI
jgi:hypothetical protein